MANLSIIAAGPYTTVQDSGRTGYQAFGVPEGGTMDNDARICGNWLVGNSADAAGLEVYIGGLHFTVDAPLVIALTGTPSDQLHITNQSGAERRIEAGQTSQLESGDSVFLPPMRGSNLAFIALSCVFDLPAVYGSLSTSLNAQLGGLNGRRLAPGDRIKFTPQDSPYQPRALDDNANFFAPADSLSVVLGPQDYAFAAEEIDKLLSHEWTLSPKMDRMGIRLTGPSIAHKNSADILSDGIVKGAIQIPGDGQPIIMMADHQTTGGYTKIACVISADLGKLARLHAHKKIRLITVTQSEAELLAGQHAAELVKQQRNDIA